MIYLAHPIVYRKECREWELAFEARHPSIELVNPFYDAEAMNKEEIEKLDAGMDAYAYSEQLDYHDVVAQDKALIARCDATLAFVPKDVQSVGTVWEIQHTREVVGKPCYVVTQGHWLMHPWLRDAGCMMFSHADAFERYIMPARIAFVGKMGSGKTSSALWLEHNYRFTRFSFADKLKEICADLFDMKEKDRALLQRFGTDIMRKNFPGVWRDYLVRKIRASGSNRVVVDDCRFIDEAEALRLEGFTIIRVVKKGERRADGLNEATSQHVSEREQDSIVPDLTIAAKDLLELHIKLDEVFQDYLDARLIPQERAGVQYMDEEAIGALGLQPGTTSQGETKDVKWLIAECEKRMKAILAHLAEEHLGVREQRFYNDAFTKVAGTLAKLYEMRGEEISKMDIVRLLSKVESMPDDLKEQTTTLPKSQVVDKKSFIPRASTLRRVKRAITSSTTGLDSLQKGHRKGYQGNKTRPKVKEVKER